jgi:ADP-ribose pyrophosphatase YjhB (NUDIX family)
LTDIGRVRYQGAIIQNDHLLLILWRDQEPDRCFWVIPGGGMEAGESAEACLEREVKEETHLNIDVEKLIFDEAGYHNGKRWMFKTYLCRVIGGKASPGHEPEDPQPEGYGIVEVKWFNLKDERGWGQMLIEDKITYPQLKRIRAVLGYAEAEIR